MSKFFFTSTFFTELQAEQIVRPFDCYRPEGKLEAEKKIKFMNLKLIFRVSFVTLHFRFELHDSLNGKSKFLMSFQMIIVQSLM